GCPVSFPPYAKGEPCADIVSTRNNARSCGPYNVRNKINSASEQEEESENMNSSLRASIIVIFVVASLCIARASTVRGVVTDPLGAVVPNAQVELLSKGQKVAGTFTDAEGKYQLAVPKSGSFRLRITAPTFAATETDSFYLSGTQNISRDVFLKIKGMAQ